MNSRGPKVRQAAPAVSDEPVAVRAESGLAVVAAEPTALAPDTHGHHALDPHVGRAQFMLLAAIGLSMFLGFGALAVTGASAHAHGTAFLSAVSALGLGMTWFYAGALERKTGAGALVSAAHVPARPVLPQRILEVQPAMRRGLWFVFSFFSAATVMFGHLSWWLAARSPNAYSVGAFVGGAFVALFGVFTGVGAVALARELRGKPRYGDLDRVERWCRVHDLRVLPPTALDPGARVFVIDDPQGSGGTIELEIASYEATPWIISGHALAVFSPSAPSDVQLVREDGAPFSLEARELDAINALVDEPRSYRS